MSDADTLERPPRPFLLTPIQHRAAAQQLRQAGEYELGQQHDNLARAIERRELDMLHFADEGAFWWK